jgi:hypothetical protein
MALAVTTHYIGGVFLKNENSACNRLQDDAAKKAFVVCSVAAILAPLDNN